MNFSASRKLKSFAEITHQLRVHKFLFSNFGVKMRRAAAALDQKAINLIRAHKFHGAKEIEKFASHFFRVCRRRDEREKIEVDTRASKGCALWIRAGLLRRRKSTQATIGRRA